MVEADWDLIEKIGWAALMFACAELVAELAASVKSDRKIKERRAEIDPYRYAVSAALGAGAAYPRDYRYHPGRTPEYLAIMPPPAMLPPAP